MRVFHVFLNIPCPVNHSKFEEETHILSILSSVKNHGSAHCGPAETNQTRNHEVSGSTPGLVQWIKDLALL